MANPNEFSPVSESAYCGAGNVHTILLHTSPSSKVLKIFAAVPNHWKDVGFHQLRAGGGLLVSANRTGGVTKFVRILSENGGAIKLRVVDDAWESAATPPTAIPATVRVAPAAGPGSSKGEWALTLGKNESVVLYLGATAPELTIAPLAGNETEYNWWGYTREMQPLH
jgi:alpha-L-fucosidase 2